MNLALINTNLKNFLTNKIALSLFLLVLASLETGAMVLFKNRSHTLVAAGIIAYMVITLGLVYLVRNYGLAAGHALFDVSSIIIATLVGLFVLGEHAGTKKITGLVLAIISVYLLQ